MQTNNSKIEWVHLCLRNPVPPISDGSYNHLLWQILEKRNPKDLVIGEYFADSFTLALNSPIPVIQIHIPKKGKAMSKIESIRRQLLKPYRGNQLQYDFLEYIRNVVKIIKKLDNPKIMIWGVMSIVPKLRDLLPEHFITFAQRHYDYPVATSYYNSCDLVIMQTKGQLRHAFDRLPNLNPFTIVIPNGVELEVFNPQNQIHGNTQREKLNIENEKFVIIFPSKLAPYKGTSYLMEWIKRCEKEIKGVHFLVVGKIHNTLLEREKTQLENVLIESKNVTWLKGIPRSEMKLLYGLADACIMPCLWREGFSMASIEAMASGLPLIVSNSGCYKEIVKDGFNGILCDPEDLYESGLKAISLLIENDEIRQRLSKNARYYAELKLSREKVLSNFMAALEGNYELIDSDLSFS